MAKAMGGMRKPISKNNVGQKGTPRPVTTGMKKIKTGSSYGANFPGSMGTKAGINC